MFLPKGNSLADNPGGCHDQVELGTVGIVKEWDFSHSVCSFAYVVVNWAREDIGYWDVPFLEELKIGRYECLWWP